MEQNQIDNPDSRSHATPVSATPAKSEVPPEPFISNPFLVTISPLIKILRENPKATILVSLYFLLLFVANYVVTVFLTAIMPMLGLIFAFATFTIISVIVVSIGYVIAIASVQKETISIDTASRVVFNRLLSLLGLSLLVTLLLLVGFILLIIPGFYILGRLALTYIVFFEENLGPIAAIKRSFDLTKGHVWEILGAMYAGTLLTGGYGLLTLMGIVAPLIGHYQGIKTLRTKETPEPPVHWLNYAITGSIVFITVLFVGMFIFSIFVSLPEASDRPPVEQELQYETPSQDNELYYPQ